MNIGKFYKYIFYKIYRLAESMAAPWWSDFKASTSTSTLFFFLLLSILFYYKIFINRYLDLSIIISIIIFLMVSIMTLNYYLFDYRDKWKDIVKEFDSLPKKKNKKGSWLVILFVCFVFANLINAFYLAGQIDWSQYR